MADTPVQQEVTLFPGWNIVSTPMVLSSHEFSAAETVENFDIYLLDASQPSGWATMASLGQTEFMPLYGYFINNKTNINQTLAFNYDTSLEPNEKLFERTFTSEGWYSIGVANDEYAKNQDDDRTDTNNPSKILSLLTGKYDLAIDFTEASYATNRRSVVVGDPWDVVVPSDIDSLNDFRETKGYAIYIKEAGAKYIGFQNDAITTVSTGSENELIVKQSVNNPDATTLQIYNDSKSDWYTILSFVLDSGQSVDDLKLNSLPITVELSTSTFNSIVGDVELEIGGTIINNYSVVENGSQAELIFNVGGNVLIYTGEKIEANLKVRFNAINDNGITISASMDNPDAIEVQGLIPLTSSQLSGSALGQAHILLTAGIYTEMIGDSAAVTTGDNANDDYATFEIEVEVTAFEQDVYIETDASDIDVDIVTSAGAVASATPAVVLTSSADEVNSRFEITEGSTETITIQVTYGPDVAGQSVRMLLNSIGFYDVSSGGSVQTQPTLPASDYRTSVVTIVN